MFEHSVKVPRLYKTAAKIAERVKLHGESVKQVYNDKLKHRNIKALYALIVSTVQNDSNLEFLLKKSELLRKETRLEPWLAKVLITELLWGKKQLPGHSKPIQVVLAYQHIFNDHLNELEQPRNKNERKKVAKPRYVRVNTLKISVNEAIDAFRDEGWILVKLLEELDYAGFLSKISNLEENQFMVDIHVPQLLIFPPRTEFFTHNAYRNGLIALQDKASCLPAHILNPSPGSKVLDMCAAPGMKTTQLACIMNGSGVIYAVDRDLKRAAVLRGVIEASGAQDYVRVVERDVLDICKRKARMVLDASDDEKFKEGSEKDEDGVGKNEDDIYREVDYILVDPSCSGSGMVEGPENIGNFRTDQSRLKKLAGFQIMILKHALRSFPSAKRVVYSTCSLNIEENEEVIREVLQSTRNFKLIDVKTLCSPWIHFGSDSFGDIGSYCLYTRPDEDLTNGFFVAVFDRLESGEENKFLLQKEQNADKLFKKFNYSKKWETEGSGLGDFQEFKKNGLNYSNGKEYKSKDFQDASIQNIIENKNTSGRKVIRENQNIDKNTKNIIDDGNVQSRKLKKKTFQQNFELDIETDVKHSNNEENRTTEITENNKTEKRSKNIEVNQQFQKNDENKKKFVDYGLKSLENVQNIAQVSEGNHLECDENIQKCKKNRQSLQNCPEKHKIKKQEKSTVNNKDRIKKRKRKNEQQTMEGISRENQYKEENINCGTVAISVIIAATKKPKKEKILKYENDDVDINRKDEKKKTKKRKLEEHKNSEEKDGDKNWEKKIKKDKTNENVNQ